MRRIYNRLLRNCSIDSNGYSLVEMVIVIIFATVAIPAVVGMYTTVLTNSHNAEIMSVANLLAAEQIEIIFADKAGTGPGYGYSAINSQKYTDVTPTSPFNGYSRTVSVQTVNAGQAYEYKLITVTVGHPLIPDIVHNSFVMDHESL